MPKERKKGPPTNLDFEKALMFFHAYMYGPLQGKLRLYRARNVHAAGKVHPSDWEVFASILVKDVGTKLGKGSDLRGAEVKSAENKGSFEYQYHKDSGKNLLKKHPTIGHLFFTHSNNLRRVELRYLHGSQLAEQFFDKWLAGWPSPYRQRYRKGISCGFVQNHGVLLMVIEDGEVTFPKTAAASPSAISEGITEQSGG